MFLTRRTNARVRARRYRQNVVERLLIFRIEFSTYLKLMFKILYCIRVYGGTIGFRDRFIPFYLTRFFFFKKTKLLNQSLVTDYIELV